MQVSSKSAYGPPMAIQAMHQDCCSFGLQGIDHLGMEAATARLTPNPGRR